VQAERFIKIKNTFLYEKLDERSKTIIEYRIENPDLSYAEIGQLCDMTKAQVNYYIKKIERKYLKYNSNLVKSL
jgi:DNA-binding transcriptional regulator WhiA